jgi:hypothetical protein
MSPSKKEDEIKMAERKLNFSINEGDVFFAHEMSINFNPTQFVLDFKCVTPRVDPRSQENTVISIKHNVVLVDPFHAKKVAAFLAKRVADYEKEFGKIEKPKAIREFEKKHKKEKDKQDDEKTQVPSYFG